MGKYIDADELKKRAEHCIETTDAFIELIDSAPTVDAEPIRHGKWVNYGCCSFCGKPDPYYCFITEYKSYYCPHCGAKMDEGKK